ncbi:MAG: hypothetical protein OXU78_00265 [Deltaproteobacteria bacterium]|nr:hypothetical protein [Deltaproteobacteria bacterium]MDD9828417.1 hypothetical protein [Deltaproteobacteria bacterium]MDD9852379.1 hypothetical protein [Deltaproteobacteria bacterium]MDD9873844.1 hypothetical protein [Deltaproteobacteria bacterium]
MARAKLPDPLARRHLLSGELAPARARAIAEAYLAEGRSMEAIAFLHKAAARPELEALRAEALQSGDVFLLREVSAALAEPPDLADWNAVAEAARACGKALDAAEAQRQAERLGGKGGA